MKGSGPVFSKSKAQPLPKPPSPPPPPPPQKKRKSISFSSDTSLPEDIRKEEESNIADRPFIRNKKRRIAVTKYYNQQAKEKEAQWLRDLRSGKKTSGGAHTRRKRSASARSRKRTTRKHRKRGKKTRKVRK